MKLNILLRGWGMGGVVSDKLFLQCDMLQIFISNCWSDTEQAATFILKRGKTSVQSGS